LRVLRFLRFSLRLFVRFLFFKGEDSPIAGVVTAAVEAAVIKKVVKASRKKK
jgi:multisubunit Na+/H+ antiporter MnhB subunit